MRTCAFKLRQRIAAVAAIAVAWVLALAVAVATSTHAETTFPTQEPSPPSNSEPSSTLTDALVAACRANEAQFAKFLTAANSSAYVALPPDQRRALLARISLVEEPGRPLISSDAQNHTVVRCQSPSQPSEFRFGDERVQENLAFVRVNAGADHQIEFGLVREGGKWHLLSLGLVLLDIPQLAHEWVEQDFAAREEAAIATLRALAAAIGTYRRAFGKLPESLAQMGPAPANEVSPEQADLVNEQMAAGSQAGYQFRYRIVPAPNDEESTFEIAAAPGKYGETGRRSFFLDSRGKLHAADKHGRVATFEDPLAAGEKAE